MDGVEDIKEPGYHITQNPDPNGDNWSISNPAGTEGNGVFDWTDINENTIQDSEDEFEIFMDAGADTLWSYSEEGYNPFGKENNNTYDLGEPFEDCGIDQSCDGDPIGDPDQDDYVPDPALDDFNNSDSTGTEGNGILDWTDGNGNNLWDEGEGEEWFDWGIDQLLNESEPYYGSRRLAINQSPQYFEWNYPEEIETSFDEPVLDSENGEEATIWISTVSPVEGTDLFDVTISMHTILPLIGFQLRLTHVPFMFSQSNFSEVNTSLWQIDSEKIIDDISLYNIEPYPDSILEDNTFISYGLNLKSFVDFYELDDFIIENPEAIISKAMLHFRIDTSQSHVNNNMVLTLNRLTDFITLPSDSLPLEPIISMNLLNINDTNEISFDVKSHIQHLSYGTYSNYGFILEANHNAYNFSQLKIYNHNDSDSLKPYLEILYSK